MGNTGSFSSKAEIPPPFFTFTTWNAIDINDFRLRGMEELSETFAVRIFEMEFLLGKDMVDFNTMRVLFNNYFDTDGNKMVDKLEVMSVVGLVSRMSNLEKIHFIFDLFNFLYLAILYKEF